MKKIFALALLLISGIISGFSQTTIVGGDFESWRLVTPYNYYEPDNSWFSTLNKLDTVAAMRPMITVFPCDTAHSGTYSARVITRFFPTMGIIIPGVIGTIKIDWMYERAILGMPYPYGDSLPQVFSGYYQSYPVGSDSSAAVILLSKWNSTLHKRDTIAYDYLALHGTVNSWTRFEMPITYLLGGTKPDSLTILLLSCGGFNAHNMFGSQGQAGSMALFDDVTLTGVSGVPMLVMPSLKVQLSPNPASDLLKIDLETSVKGAMFEVYNSQGKFLARIPVEGVHAQFSAGDLSAGLYYYKLSGSNGKLLNSGTFIVTK